MVMVSYTNRIMCLIVIINSAAGEPPDFRVLAPEFVCPKDEEAAKVEPDNTVITLSMKAGFKLDTEWTVRWTPLPAPTQRFTLMLWKSARTLEKNLNGPQKEPYVYVIENDELLPGVNYIFNVTATNAVGEATTKSFHIDNVQGDQVLQHVEGRADMLSILLVGGQETYADVDFALEAQVTTCFPTQDYKFEWTVASIDSGDKVDTASSASRLEIPAYSLTAGLTYYASCQVLRHSNGDFITQNGLPFRVLRREIEVYLNVDRLVVPVGAAFSVEAVVLNHDYFGDNLTYFWECTHDNESCDAFENLDNSMIYFKNGFVNAGMYEVVLTVTVQGQSATASAFITAVEHNGILPLIQISPFPRILNEGTKATLVANASNVTPTCSLTWYFASEEYLLQNTVENDTCVDCQHGEPLSETLTIYSLEENFLNEITDFTNETEWKQVTAEMAAAAGRARFVVQCGCLNEVANCAPESVYVDVTFKLNEIARAKKVMIKLPAGLMIVEMMRSNHGRTQFLTQEGGGQAHIQLHLPEWQIFGVFCMITPDSGSALETIVRISTLAVVDTNTPLYYTFLCRVGMNVTLVLGSYAEHLSVETFLPYIGEEGTEIWVEVCDVIGACSESTTKVVALSPGDGTTVATLLRDVLAHARRCELMQLQRVSVAAIVTYKNAGQSETLSEFCTSLLSALSESQDCLETKPKQYEDFHMKLKEVGCDATQLIDNYPSPAE